MISYVVKKRFGDEKIDIREFIRPNNIGVMEIASQMPANRNEFIKSSWKWVTENIIYPPGQPEIADRHYKEAFNSGSKISPLITSTIIGTGLAGMVREFVSGASIKNIGLIVRDTFIGQGLASLIMSLFSGGARYGNSSLLRYETFDFWSYPSETLRDRVGDCEDTSILLASILRNRLSHNEVFVTIGYFDGIGHAWVTVNHPQKGNIVLETTSDQLVEDKLIVTENLPYVPILRFNDINVIEVDSIEKISFDKEREAYKFASLNTFYKSIGGIIYG